LSVLCCALPVNPPLLTVALTGARGARILGRGCTQMDAAEGR